MPQYGFNVQRPTTGAFGAFVKALGGNPLRRSVVVSNPIFNVLWLSTTAKNDFSGGWLHLNGPGSIVLPFRDYGPLITAEIWVTHSTAGTQVSVTEVFEIPTG